MIRLRRAERIGAFEEPCETPPGRIIERDGAADSDVSGAELSAGSVAAGCVSTGAAAC